MTVRRALRPLQNAGIYFGLITTLLLPVLAYQTRPSYDIVFGSATDAPLHDGFNAPEKIPGDDGIPYRWSTGYAQITLRDVARQEFDGVITVSGSRPPGQEQASFQLRTGERVLVAEQPPPVLTEYRFRIPREDVERGTLRLELTSNVFSPPGDPRELGLIVTRLKLSPTTSVDRFIEPPTGVSLSLLMSSALLGLLLSLMGWHVAAVALGGSVPGLLGGWLLVADRLWLTTGEWHRTWPLALVAGATLVGSVSGAGGWLLKRLGTPWSGSVRRALLTLLLAAFVVRLAGQLHPQIFIIDLFFHLHRLETVETGQLLFTIQSAEWGGRSTFYLPTSYIVMLPLQWLLSDRLLVIRLLTVGLGTLGAFLVYLLAARAARKPSAGVLGAGLYLFVPMAVLPYSWGITTNVFGEFSALAAMTIAVLGYRELTPRRPAFWMLLLGLLAALLSHPGVVQLSGAAMVFIVALWLAGRRKIGSSSGAIWALAALSTAVILAYVLYYRHFLEGMLTTLAEIRQERALEGTSGAAYPLIGGSVSDRSLGLVVRYATSASDWLAGGLRGFWQEAHVYYRVWPLMASLLGFMTIWSGAGRVAGGWAESRRRLVLAAAGWSLAVILFALVGWAANLYVRYSLFALPVVALGSGLFLSRLWECGRWGRVMGLFVLAYFAAEALALWQYRISYAFK